VLESLINSASDSEIGSPLSGALILACGQISDSFSVLSSSKRELAKLFETEFASEVTSLALQKVLSLSQIS
jgi:hypothetical protein